MDLSLLRYSDLDYLEEVAKYYQNNKRYAISRAWDELLRAKLEEDYDYRFKFFDFDYGTEVARRPGGQRVCKSEYIHWRNTGEKSLIRYVYLLPKGCFRSLGA